MSDLSSKATVGFFGSSAMDGEPKGIRARFNARFDTAVWAALLASALFVPDGYPRLVALSILGLCSFATIVCACQRE